MKGRKPQLAADANAVTEIKPPSWLSKHAKAEWRRVMPELVKRRILTPADLGCLESYCIAIGRIRDIELLLRAGIDPKLCRMQDKAMVTARQLAAELGLTPVSRSRPAARDNDNEGDDDNPLAL
ncbi:MULTISPECIES: phage terminase small subunit P27 family [Bradyrhizobium]|uniref:phage terminase small subunit P27 family n=1 Tax=Bradyrhizobium TaxID=374 RepID=UPI000D737B92|nr:phage terminase small subunit P27 family [Bradyrhizobium diazoefficiens]AWO91936.1 phage terminase small subunit P27 family [Bradyrhizobium diazoefficiens]